MAMKEHNIQDVLQGLDPSLLSYQEWVYVGMALKDAGYPCSLWDEWSLKDAPRYHPGECEKKWRSFQGGSGAPVSIGTVVQMARKQGWTPSVEDNGRCYDWDDYVNADNVKILDPDWIEEQDLIEPEMWSPAQQIIKYLQTLFDSSDNVGYVMQSWQADGKAMPTKGNWDRTAGELIEQLSRCDDDIGLVLGDYNPGVGAWIRFNPLDGKGCSNANVSDFRYALVECDDMALSRQNAIIRELEIPVACLVHSGKKSIHAIVRIDADSYEQYRARVDYLYDVCRKNGLSVDNQNRNPSRLSRLPGVMRAGRKQWLIDTNIGKASWQEWRDWIEGINDDLPPVEQLSSIYDNLPELAPPLIEGLLRQGHKMLIAGASKAGKSYALIELCIAIAEGREWLGWQCAQGKVLYINLELDRASCLHRFKDVYQAQGWRPSHLRNLDIWNLRGRGMPMDKLAPKLIRRALKSRYIAIVIDPIYKVITGDENSADQMAQFCNQFDKVCTDLGCAVIYCHHHSKGNQAGKRSMDRASGSGVFARDPDTLLDLIELDITDALRKAEINKAYCTVYADALAKSGHIDRVSQDAMCSATQLDGICSTYLTPEQYSAMRGRLQAVHDEVLLRTAWRIEGTLREFPKFPPKNMWFDFPIHRLDDCGVLQDLNVDTPAKGSHKSRQKNKAASAAEAKKQSIEVAYDACAINGEPVTVDALSSYLGVSSKTMRRYIKAADGYEVKDSVVTKAE